MLIDDYGYHAAIYSMVYFVVTTISTYSGINPPPEWFWLMWCFLLGPIGLVIFFHMIDWIKEKHFFKR